PGDALLVKEALAMSAPGEFDVKNIKRLSEIAEAINSYQPEVILLDLSLPDTQGVETLRHALTIAPDLPIIVCTGVDDEAIGIRSVHEGAQDYLVKGQLQGIVLCRSIRYAIERKQSEKLIHRMAHFDALTGLPNRLLFLDRLAQAVAQTERTGKILA